MQTMNDSQWDAKLKSFLKKTGDDFKRFGNDVKVEAEKTFKREVAIAHATVCAVRLPT
jgi:hypothetical protein